MSAENTFPTAQNPVRRILVVDDEHVIADSLALIFSGHGFETRSAYSGEQAAEVALAWHPDAVVADVIMGKMDGIALAMFLAQALPACKVILMSGAFATAPLINESKKLGHNFPLLAKPFHPDRVLELLGVPGRAEDA